MLRSDHTLVYARNIRKIKDVTLFHLFRSFYVEQQIMGITS